MLSASILIHLRYLKVKIVHHKLKASSQELLKRMRPRVIQVTNINIKPMNVRTKADFQIRLKSVVLSKEEGMIS